MGIHRGKTIWRHSSGGLRVVELLFRKVGAIFVLLFSLLSESLPHSLLWLVISATLFSSRAFTHLFLSFHQSSHAEQHFFVFFLRQGHLETSVNMVAKLFRQTDRSSDWRRTPTLKKSFFSPFSSLSRPASFCLFMIDWAPQANRYHQYWGLCFCPTFCLLFIFFTVTVWKLWAFFCFSLLKLVLCFHLSIYHEHQYIFSFGKALYRSLKRAHF